MNAANQNIGSRIKEHREALRLSQAQIATYLDIDQSTVSLYEKGERALSISNLDRLAKLFCCPVSELTSDVAVDSRERIAFRTSELSADDLFALSGVNQVILNLEEMVRISNG